MAAGSHPCKKRKGGAPPVRVVPSLVGETSAHYDAKGGPAPWLHSRASPTPSSQHRNCREPRFARLGRAGMPVPTHPFFYFEVLGGAAGATSTSRNFGSGRFVLETGFSPLELNRGSLSATRSGCFVV